MPSGTQSSLKGPVMATPIHSSSTLAITRQFQSFHPTSPPRGLYEDPKWDAIPEPTYWRPQENLIYRTPSSGSITPVEHPAAPSPHDSSMKQIREMPRHRRILP
ncbi:uncharacterized protein N7484_000232 [Penicillium longicatenatum]|uniref:uncharacterized protein n=1 Tax=Penicillium longicatenatum TaxID=1561947 RepID=UPI0025483606|nr:uncharacterized protein N7484_000232 [Penicillium longicatenatum]KAJ5660860.1 hypothetical protein N7484_000232 [Penicillium longicatenatum]